MTRVAAVDCGTNSMRLLVADVEPGAATGRGAVRPIERKAPIIRLGQGLAQSGRLSDAALDRARATATEFAVRCAELGVTRLAAAATAAARMAANGQDLLDLLDTSFAAFDPRVEILSGDREAQLSFAGALTGPWDAPGPYLVVDSGGGSTELALGKASLDAFVSLPLGCVTLHETLGWPDPPTRADLEAAVSAIGPQVRAGLGQVGAARARTLVALAGGATTIAAHALGLPRYDSARVDGARLTLAELEEAAIDLALRPTAERAALPYLTPGREDVIGPAAAIWVAMARECATLGVTDLVTSERDILDGLALALT